MSFSTREDVSVKLKAGNMVAARETTKQLEVESRNMEERLTELKMAMNREKEERERKQGGYWKTGQIGSLSSFGKDAMHKAAIKEANKDKKKKVKVLKDEPIVAPERNKGPGTLAFIAKKGGAGSSGRSGKEKLKGPRCGQCEEKVAHVSCVECGEDYCASCFASFHLKGALKKHRSLPIGSNGIRTPRAQCMEPAAVTNGNTSTAIDPGDNSIMKVTLSDIDFGFAQEALKEAFPPSPDSSPQQGPSLLEGDYNEGARAAEFQEALRAWRGEGESKGKVDSKGKSPAVSMVPPVNTHVVSTETSTSTNDLASKSSVSIKFKTSLTYAEKLMLKHHRRSQLGTLHNDSINQEFSGMRPYNENADIDPELLPDENNHVDFQSMYVAMGLPQYQTPEPSDSRPDSRISIVEIDSKVRNRRVEESSSYQVTELSEEPPHQGRRATHVPSSPPQMREAFVSPVPDLVPKTTTSNQQLSSFTSQNQGKSLGIPTNIQSPTSDMKSGSKCKNILTPNSAKVSTRGGRRKRDSDESLRGTPRVSSRAASRLESRPRSRAEIKQALFGEGELTKAPSASLHEVASMTNTLSPAFYDSHTTGLGEFFTAGVDLSRLASTQERCRTPSRPRSTTEGKWKVSNKLYKMAPRSWRPGSSLSNALTDDQTAHLMEDDAIETYNKYLNSGREDEVSPPEDGLSYSLCSGEATSWRKENSLLGNTRHPMLTVNSNPTSNNSLQKSTPPKHEASALRWSAKSPPLSSYQERASSRALSRSGRESVMIVPDGEDMSIWDDSEVKVKQDRDDEDAIVQLERELTSQASVFKEKSNLSQLSVVETDDDLPWLSEDEEGGVAAADEAELDHRLRESVIMNDFEEMEARMMEEEADDMADVKALS